MPNSGCRRSPDAIYNAVWSCVVCQCSNSLFPTRKLLEDSFVEGEGKDFAYIYRRIHVARLKRVR